MNLKEELQELSGKLEMFRRKLTAAEKREDRSIMLQFRQEINKVTKRIASVKTQQTRELSKQGGSVKGLAFSRVLTKEEQSDMGKLKKTVKGLVVVHPMTALGREMGITKVTGFAPKAF